MLAGFIVNFELIQHIIQYPNWLHQKALKGLKGNGFFSPIFPNYELIELLLRWLIRMNAFTHPVGEQLQKT